MYIKTKYLYVIAFLTDTYLCSFFPGTLSNWSLSFLDSSNAVSKLTECVNNLL